MYQSYRLVATISLIFKQIMYTWQEGIFDLHYLYSVFSYPNKIEVSKQKSFIEDLLKIKNCRLHVIS